LRMYSGSELDPAAGVPLPPYAAIPWPGAAGSRPVAAVLPAAAAGGPAEKALSRAGLAGAGLG
jgi:hypothetical protein